jgi:hypothetical protein
MVRLRLRILPIKWHGPISGLRVIQDSRLHPALQNLWFRRPRDGMLARKERISASDRYHGWVVPRDQSWEKP